MDSYKLTELDKLTCMINIRRVVILDGELATDNVHIVDFSKKKILFSGKRKGRDGMKTSVDYFEEGLSMGLHLTGANFLYNSIFMTQENLDEFINS